MAATERARSATTAANWSGVDDEGAAGAEVTGSGEVVTGSADVVAGGGRVVVGGGPNIADTRLIER
jgi:hypothetical protein